MCERFCLKRQSEYTCVLNPSENHNLMIVCALEQGVASSVALPFMGSAIGLVRGLKSYNTYQVGCGSRAFQCSSP
jgi:hypothetical protein